MWLQVIGAVIAAVSLWVLRREWDRGHSPVVDDRGLRALRDLPEAVES